MRARLLKAFGGRKGGMAGMRQATPLPFGAGVRRESLK